MNKLPNILARRQVAKTRLFSIEELELRFSNGEERTYERLGSIRNTGHKAVMVVPLLDDNRFFMIREYAAGTENYQLTLPKGLVEPGESVLEGANRELKEEIGYGANSIKLLTKFTLSPNYMCNSIYVVVARNLYEEKLEGDEPEPLGLEVFSFDQLLEINERQDFSEGRALAALYLVRDQLKLGLL